MTVDGPLTVLKVLILEDEEADAVLLVQALRKAGYNPDCSRAEDEAGYQSGLAAKPDIIIADYHLPRFSVARALAQRQQQSLAIPFIVVSGHIDATEAVEVIQRGAADYLPKDQFSRLGGVVARALDQQRALKTLRSSEEHYRMVAETASDAIMTIDGQDRILYVNASAEQIFGYSRAELVGQDVAIVMPESSRAEHRDALHNYLRTHRRSVPWAYRELVGLHKSGRLIPLEMSFSEHIQDGEPRFTAMFRDAGERKQAEDVMRYQRALMESQGESAPDGILIVSPQQEILYYNRRLCEMWGVAPDAMRHITLTNFRRAMSAKLLDRRYRDMHPEEVVHDEVRLNDGRTFDRYTSPVVSNDNVYYGRAWYYRDITNRRQAQEALGRYVQRLEGLNEIDNAILAAQSPAEIARTTLTHLRRLMSVERAALWLFDFEKQESVLLCEEATADAWRLETDARVPLARIVESTSLQQLATQYICDLSLERERSPRAERLLKRGFRSLIVAALRIDNNVIGEIELCAVRPGAFTVKHLEIAAEVANQAAIAIHHSQLLEAEKRAREVTETMRAANTALTDSLDMDAVLAALLDHLHTLVPSDRAAVLLLKNDEFAVIRATRGDALMDGARPGEPVEVRNSAGFGEVYATRGGVVIADTLRYAGRLPARWGARVRSWLGVPLRADGQLVGILTLHKAEPGFFTAQHLQWAEALSAEAEAAIQNATLYEQMHDQRERLKALSQRLVQIQEAERRHIARELHDEIGQILTGLSLTLDMARGKPAEQVNDLFGEADKLISDLSTRVDNLSLELRPSILDDLGLLPAILWHTKRYTEQTHVHVALTHNGINGRRFSQSIETTAYRVMQESLTNAARYAHVSEVTLDLWAGDDTLTIQVEDHGAGFNTELVLKAGTTSGLAGMQERALLAGGQLVIESTPDAGTTIIATLPLNP